MDSGTGNPWRQKTYCVQDVVRTKVPREVERVTTVAQQPSPEPEHTMSLCCTPSVPQSAGPGLTAIVTGSSLPVAYSFWARKAIVPLALLT